MGTYEKDTSVHLKGFTLTLPGQFGHFFKKGYNTLIKKSLAISLKWEETVLLRIILLYKGGRNSKIQFCYYQVNDYLGKA